MESWLIQLGEKNLFAGSKADWASMNQWTLRFDSEEEAEQFRKDYCWEEEAKVIRHLDLPPW